MATAFSETERRVIKEKLKAAAQECLGKYGVKRTTVDQLVQMAGISKGAFYKFYETKEIIFFEVIEEYQKSVVEELSNRLAQMSKVGRQEFTELLFMIYRKVRLSFMVNVIANQEIEYITRKIPESYIYEHHSFDDELAEKLLAHIKTKKNLTAGVIAAALRAIFMSMLHVREIGEKDFDEVLHLLIAGFVCQITEEDQVNE